MGVRGLLSYCLDHRVDCAVYVDILQQAHDNDGLELLVDFYAFEHFVLQNFWKSLTACSGNQYIKLQGGNYRALDIYVSTFVKILQEFGVNLAFYIDGAKGSSGIATEQKFETWKRRHAQDVRKMVQVLEVAEGKRRIADLDESCWVRPVLLEIQLFETLKQCGCDVVHVCYGEADSIMAKAMLDRPKAFAILSNDSDFCVFKDCRLIPFELFDTNKNMDIGSTANWLPQKPNRLVCGYVSSGYLQNHFKFSGWKELVEFSLLAGNDFTGHHMMSVRDQIGLGSRARIGEIAECIRHHHRLENIPGVNQSMDSIKGLRNAVQFARSFYDLYTTQEPFKGYLTQFLQEAISQGCLPNNFMAMHNNFYWHRMLMEDVRNNGVEISLQPLRAFVYKMVLHSRDQYVEEYVRTWDLQLTTMHVYKTQDPRVQLASDVNKDQIFRNLRAFASIMTHLEPHSGINFFDKYGRRNGFNLHVLRYMYVLNMERNLCLTLDEVIVLSATVFCRVDEPWYTGLAIVPSVRSITVSSWFQDLYRHAYLFLGKLLCVSHEFPEPKEFMCGAVFTAFYSVLMHQGTLHATGFPKEWLERIKTDMNYIIGEKRHIIKTMLAGCLDFNTNFRYYVS